MDEQDKRSIFLDFIGLISTSDIFNMIYYRDQLTEDEIDHITYNIENKERLKTIIELSQQEHKVALRDDRIKAKQEK